MDEKEKLNEYINKHNLRKTPQRDIILDKFLECEDHISVQDFYQTIRDEYPEIGIATVRRSLNLFVECGIANRLKFDEGEAVYEHKRTHHDHLICTKCGKIIEFRDGEIERRQEVIAQANNFQICSHKLQIYGLCNDCREL